MTDQEKAEFFVRYFKQYCTTHDDQTSRDYLRLAEEWFRLVNINQPNKSEVQTLKAEIEALQLLGTATIELKRVVKSWATKILGYHGVDG